MPVCRLSLFIALCLTSSVALAGPALDKARREKGVARSALQTEQTKQAELQSRINGLQTQLDHLKRLRDATPIQGKELEKKEDAESKYTPKEIAQARETESVRREAFKSFNEAQEAYREALQKQNAARSRVNELRSKQVVLLEESAAFRKAVADVLATMKQQRTVHREEMEKLHAGEEYRRGKAELDAAQAQLEHLRDKEKLEFLDPRMQAAISRKTAAASALANMESLVATANPRYLEASRESLAAEKRRDAVRAEFDKEQERKPELASALEALAQAEREAKERERQAEKARAELDDANRTAMASKARDAVKIESQIERQEEQMKDLPRRFDALNREIAEANVQMNQQKRRVELAQKRFNDAIAAESAAVRKEAQDSLKKK